MALIKCPECGNDVSTEASACPKCGFPIREKNSQIKHEDEQEKEGIPFIDMRNLDDEQEESAPQINYNAEKKGGCLKAVLVIIGILLGIIVLGAMCSGESDNWNTENKAKTYAELIVKDSLKAPSTAKFCNSAREMTAKNLGGAKWKVTGWVDAENSFGAMIRSDFEVVLELNKNGATRISCSIKKR